ncbi:carboxylesterase/lipase family protein [Pseudonocardia sp. CA-107938]|uniref:carboxylesterase/lipase family protein n=1 Tax=Pseudonocardia sp. CA-107938 TaxID=3240021 RepID=UPI003D8BD3F2
MGTRTRTTAGTIEGTQQGEVTVFRGVPFAARPVGAARFAAPRPTQAWDGVRDATEFGPPPPQPGRSTEGDDWLTLTVWTPDPGRTGLPVIVWISGGGYLRCNSASPTLDGATLAAGGVVVVSAHYRTGAEGFARLAGAPDNRGLLDQLAALQWVQDNAAAFGGDPGNVTVFGQSAGAGSIAALLAMPASAGLFRRAILHSVPGTFFSTELADDISAEIAAEIGRTPRAAELAALAPDDLVAAAAAVTGRLSKQLERWGGVACTPTPFSPVVDGEVLPEAPWPALARGAARDLELLVAHTRDEYAFLADLLGVEETAVDHVDPTPGLARYRASGAFTADELRDNAMADWLMRMPTLHLAEAALVGGARVWLAELLWGFAPAGATHSLDTLLVYGTADFRGEITAAGPAALAQAQRLGEVMRAEHLAFVAKGDPGWTPYDLATRRTRVYDAEPAVLPYPEERSRELWRGLRFGVLGLSGSRSSAPRPSS